MFNPSQDDVRRFFCSVYEKMQRNQPMQAIETLAGLWIEQHPEYHADLADVEAAVLRQYPGQLGGGTHTSSNPFLHLSMHLSISEQCSIDQPPGIRHAIEHLSARCDSLHEAHHHAMQCLGEMLWDSQQNGTPPDAQLYVERVRRYASKD